MRAPATLIVLSLLFLLGSNSGKCDTQKTTQKKIVQELPCNLYKNSEQGHPNVDEIVACTIPDIAHLDTSVKLGLFTFQGGSGGQGVNEAGRTNPPGLEIRAYGGADWAVWNPVLERDSLQLNFYCGHPGGANGGCNVGAHIFAHYVYTVVDDPVGNDTSQPKVEVKPTTPAMPSTDWNKWLGFGFGVIFLIILLFISTRRDTDGKERPLSPLAVLICRVILALCAAGIGAVIPGWANYKSPGLSAGGAIVLFLVVYLWNPAERNSEASKH